MPHCRNTRRRMLLPRGLGPTRWARPIELTSSADTSKHRLVGRDRANSEMKGRLVTSDTPVDEIGSGIEPPVTQRVRTAFGLLERVAPRIGARWATELWCTPPAVEMSLRMPPGVSPGQPVEASWRGHRLAGESW